MKRKTTKRRQRTVIGAWAGGSLAELERWGLMLLQGVKEVTGDPDWELQEAVRGPGLDQGYLEDVVHLFIEEHMFLDIVLIYPQAGLCPKIEAGPSVHRDQYVALLVNLSLGGPDREILNDGRVVRLEAERNIAINEISEPSYILNNSAKRLREMMELGTWRSVDEQAYKHRQKTSDVFNPKNNGKPVSWSSHLGPKVKSEISGKKAKAHRIGAFVDPISTLPKGEPDEVLEAGLALLPPLERILFGLDCAEKALPFYEARFPDDGLRLLLTEARDIALDRRAARTGSQTALVTEIQVRVRRQTIEYEGEIQRRALMAVTSALEAAYLGWGVRTSYHQILAASYARQAVREDSHLGMEWQLKILSRYLRQAFDEAMLVDLPALEGHPADVTQGTIIRAQSYTKLQEILTNDAWARNPTTSKKAQWCSTQFQEQTGAYEWVAAENAANKIKMNPLERLCRYRFADVVFIVNEWKPDRIPKVKIGLAEPSDGGEGDDGGEDRKIKSLLEYLPPKLQHQWATDCLQHVLPEFERAFPGKDYLSKIISLRRDFSDGKVSFNTLMVAGPSLFPFPAEESQTLLWAFYTAAMTTEAYDTSRAAAEAVMEAQGIGYAYALERKWQLQHLEGYVNGTIGKKGSSKRTVKGRRSLPVQVAGKEARKTFRLGLLPRDMREEFFNLHATSVNPEITERKFGLMEVPTGLLDISKISVHVPAEELKRYEVKDFSVLPPIVIAEGKLIDGQHRIASAQKAGVTRLRYIDMTGLLIPELTGYITEVEPSDSIKGRRSLPAREWIGPLPKVGQKVRTACPIREEGSVCRNWNARLPEIGVVAFVSPTQIFLEGNPRPFTRKPSGAWVLEGYTVKNGPYLEPLSKSTPT